MESLLRYLTFQQSHVEKMLDAAAPTEAQLSGYMSSLSDTLCNKALVQAPSDVKAICFKGLKIMGNYKLLLFLMQAV